MKKEYNIFGIEFKNLNNLSIYLENFNNQSGLKRIEEKDKVVYIKGNNVSLYQREYESVLTLEPLILMDMRNRKEKKVYIEFPGRVGYGTNFPKILIEQNNNFDPYPDTSKILNLKTDSRTEYLKIERQIILELMNKVFNIKNSSAIKKITFYENENLEESYVVVNFKGTNEDYIYNITKRLSSVLKQTLQYAITNNLSIGSWYNFNFKECEEFPKEKFENKIMKNFLNE